MDGLDFTERAGFLVGKSAALADWQHRKEAEAFDALCRRLRHTNYMRDYRKTPEYRAQRARHQKEVRASEEYKAARRAFISSPAFLAYRRTYAKEWRARRKATRVLLAGMRGALS